MNITEKAKTELDKRVQRIEDFIAEKGVGSSYLSRAKRVQRNVNLALVLGGILTLAGLTAWALTSSHSDDS
jgi:hypothetical protein